MLKFSYMFLLLLLSTPVLALDDAVNTNRFSDLAIDGYDVVAYFAQSAPAEGSAKYSHTWRGGEWRFVNQANLDKFIADPQAYAPQYGGWCAYAMSDKGRTVRIDPEAWTIHDGKLYLNYNKRVQGVWLEELEPNITQADGFYPQTTDVTTWLKAEQQ